MTNRRFAAALATMVSALLLSGCAAGHQRTYTASGDPGQGPIVIGADNSAESRVVAALYEQLLTAAGEKTQMANSSYGTPADTAKAVTAGTLTLAPAYESALLHTFPGGQTLPGNMTATLSMALPPGIDALPPAAVQRGVVLAVSRATAQRYDLHGTADLAKVQGGGALGGAAAQDPDAPSAVVLTEAHGVTISPSSTVGVLVLRGTDPVVTGEGLTVLADPAASSPRSTSFP
ncbi:glycine betaine ABC transporter substrate-binding protein [Kitasatospora cathayae]|uniref:ABC transporter substrate-binding protein n=1 Tax=Kitasatospora cathayae TaxID=3004092 RepID=A0ABY7PWX0_9ACTN|nr:glycine betaine ABC transporter substrate-binding protein [Kitasatospora sp. HUAS 3-15]WBP84938.1 ABC transporter substrate-binding protein [Kitasatospora sp. HUAS 3-15]